MKALAVCMFLAFACAAPLPPQQASNEPAKAPDIRGVITHLAANEIRVEAMPRASNGAKAVVKLTKETAVLDQGGKTVGANALREGQHVSVWFTGEIAQSYPLQATASRIVIE